MSAAVRWRVVGRANALRGGAHALSTYSLQKCLRRLNSDDARERVAYRERRHFQLGIVDAHFVALANFFRLHCLCAASIMLKRCRHMEVRNDGACMQPFDQFVDCSREQQRHYNERRRQTAFAFGVVLRRRQIICLLYALLFVTLPQYGENLRYCLRHIVLMLIKITFHVQC